MRANQRCGEIKSGFNIQLPAPTDQDRGTHELINLNRSIEKLYKGVSFSKKCRKVFLEGLRLDGVFCLYF